MERPMARPSKMHLHKGQWRTRIAGREYYLGSDERKAQHEFYKLMAAATRADPSDRPATVNGAIRAYLGLRDSRGNRQRLADFATFAGEVFLDDVERDLLTRFLIHLRGRTFKAGKHRRRLSPQTLLHYVKTARAVLRLAHKNEWIASVPELPDMEKPMRKARDIAPPRLREIFATMRPRTQRLCRFIAATGCRPGEACKLRWSQVRLDMGVCVLDEHKTAGETGAPRTLYLTPDALAVLAETPREGDHVFYCQKGRPHSPGGLKSTLRPRGIYPYQLRHSFAQFASDSGCTTDVLARLLGHKNEATTKFYADVRDARVVGIASNLRILSAG